MKKVREVFIAFRIERNDYIAASKRLAAIFYLFGSIFCIEERRDMKNIRRDYRATIYACYLGYITQAVINSFLPLLFVRIQAEYGISLTRVTLLITFNFTLQLLIDLLSAKYADRVGYRTSIVMAHVFAAAGLILLGLLPDLLPDPYAGLLIAVMINAIGGGLTEVLISPIVEACPTDDKSSAMSMLHSFYCWGVVGVVLISTLFFRLFGIERWHILSCLWAVIPVVTGILFLFVPINHLTEEGQGMTIRQLLHSRMFYILFLMMLCAGAAEQAMSQWSSAFAERGLGVNKTMGDLAGPCMFSVLMGTARVIHAKLTRIDLKKYIAFCCGLCVAGYLLAVFAPYPVAGLIGCGIVGFAVGVFWPGSFSLASAGMPTGGTKLFALLALAGDVGCSGGPTLTGMVSGAFGDNLKAGLLAAVIFPVLLAISLTGLKKPET